MSVAHRSVELPSATLSSTQAAARKFGEPICRMCLRPRSVRPITRHHLVPVAWFRGQPLPLRQIRNAHANLVPLCRPCHDLVHDRDEVEREMSRRHLRRSLTQQEVAFAIQVRGRSWLDHHYPLDRRERIE